MWRPKNKHGFRWMLLFQGRTACNLTDACHSFGEKCGIILDGINLILGRRCRQRFCWKFVIFLKKKNIFDSYEKFAFNFWLMLYTATASASQDIGRRGSIYIYIPMHTIQVHMKNRGITPLILNLGTGCRWAVSFTPQPLLTTWEKVGSYGMGCLVGPTGGFSFSIRDQVFAPDWIRTSDIYPVAMPLHNEKMFNP